MLAYSAESHQIIIHLFPKLLGFIYLVVFLPFIFQMKGLFGKKGILPIYNFHQAFKQAYGKKAFRLLPSIFWVNQSDIFVVSTPILGAFLSLLLIFGFNPTLLLIALYILYLSITLSGQEFLSFGWELFLLEITFNTIFLSLDPLNPFIYLSLNILLFRFHIQAGAVKLQSKDKNWRNLCALCYHYQTQPLPNTLAYFMHKLPVWFQKLSCLYMFFVELVVPFFIFGNEKMRLFAFANLSLLQILIWLTGNLSYLNYLTFIFTTLLLPDTLLSSIFSPPQILSTPLLTQIFVSTVAIALLSLQTIHLYHHFFPNKLFYQILSYTNPYFIANQYGIFAVMTTKRVEIIIEGSDDGITWKEYLFFFKPSETNRRPKRISPFQPRLDWQAWFLPFQSYEQAKWFQLFLYRLLQGSKPVLSLLRHNPFEKSPPKYIRAVAYDYTFTDWNTLRKTGHWWNRKYLGAYSPTLSLKKEENRPQP